MLAASRDEGRQLAAPRVSEVTPSRRDFAQYVATQKTDLAVIARLAGSSSHTAAQLIAQARDYDDAEVAALAVATGAGGLSAEIMAAIAAATTAPILRDDLLMQPKQIYHARLHGADAAVFPAAELDGTDLHELIMIASSLHMASVIEAFTPGHLDTARQFAHVIVGLRCTSTDGNLDVEATLDLARRVPRQQTVIVLPEIRSPRECAALRGTCDAVVAGEVLSTADDLCELLRELAGD